MKEKLVVKVEALKKESADVEKEVRLIDQRRGQLVQRLMQNEGSIKTLQELIKDEAPAEAVKIQEAIHGK